ncbi:acetolactate synthase AlsS [Corynebacterium kroppenstedtii]|nr:acetolactate synthase AlsS [Corynebacterium kroppenstedtii]
MIRKCDSVKSAQLIVQTLRAQGVRYIFGVPGAKIDEVYDALVDADDIEVIVCRHEQNATFMAQAIGRLTGKPGVVLVTSGPGTTNLATGLVTANTEQDPVVAIAGTVGLPDRLKRTHQSLDAVNFLAPITKFTAESTCVDDVSELITNAFREAQQEPRGAAAVMVPADVAGSETSAPLLEFPDPAPLGPASQALVDKAKERIENAKLPVLLVGMRGAGESAVRELRQLVKTTNLPVVETFQGAGVISRELENNFLGRVGLFKNQPGDVLLNKADLIISVGYDSVEYDPRVWNFNGQHDIIHIDSIQADVDTHYRPTLELVGDISGTLHELNSVMDPIDVEETERSFIDRRLEALARTQRQGAEQATSDSGVNPARLVLTLRELITDDKTTVAADIGTHSIYLARYFRTYEPRTLLFSNGQQTLGVALPWAIAAALVNRDHPVVSVSGDGGFLYSAQELETATRLGLHLVHVIMRDNSYDMVKFQQENKFGRPSAVELGDYDAVKYAEAFGAKGYRVHMLEDFSTAFSQAMDDDGVSIVDVSVDYTDSVSLAQHLDFSVLN